MFDAKILSYPLREGAFLGGFDQEKGHGRFLGVLFRNGMREQMEDNKIIAFGFYYVISV